MIRLLMMLLAMTLGGTSAWAGVNVNSAGVSELATLPGIGPKKAEAIIGHRENVGAFTSMADLDAVPGIGPSTLANLDGKVEFGDGVVAPTAQMGAIELPSEAVAGPAVRLPAASSSGSRVNINSASQGELETLPGVGPAKALAIVGEREANGDFASCDDLVRVNGIGPATVANLRERCTAQ